MNSAQPIAHHPAVSDDILLDTGARDPVFDEIYPRLPGFKLGVTNSWTRGQPFDFYRRMREDAPVMWSQIKKPSSGFWSVVRYDDVKHVELNPQIFSSQRGSINMSVLRNDKGKGRAVDVCRLQLAHQPRRGSSSGSAHPAGGFFLPRVYRDLEGARGPQD
jgi:hypothetical protein